MSNKGPEPTPERGEDFEGFLLKCTKQKPKPKLPAALKMAIDPDMEEHEKAIEILKWGDSQPSFREQFVHPGILYMVARGTPKRPKLAMQGKEFKDHKFQDFYSRLMRSGAKVFKAKGMLIKKKEVEMVTETAKKGEPLQYPVTVYYFRYSKDDNDRQNSPGGVGTKAVTLDRAQQRFREAHESIERKNLTAENQAIFDQHDKLSSALNTPKLQGLFKLRHQLPAKSGVLGDPKKN